MSEAAREMQTLLKAMTNSICETLEPFDKAYSTFEQAGKATGEPYKDDHPIYGDGIGNILTVGDLRRAAATRKAFLESQK